MADEAMLKTANAKSALTIFSLLYYKSARAESAAERRAPDASRILTLGKKKQLSKIAEFLLEGRIIYPF
jgi:hypothetical protein